MISRSDRRIWSLRWLLMTPKNPFPFMIQFFRAHSAQKKNHIFEYLETYWKILIFLQLFLVVSLKIQRNTPKNWWFEWTQQKQQICDLKPQHLTFLGEANMGRPGPPEGGGCWLGWWLVFFFVFALLFGEWKSKSLSRTILLQKERDCFLCDWFRIADRVYRGFFW